MVRGINRVSRSTLACSSAHSNCQNVHETHCQNKRTISTACGWFLEEDPKCREKEGGEYACAGPQYKVVVIYQVDVHTEKAAFNNQGDKLEKC